jgi:hypothetical protein
MAFTPRLIGFLVLTSCAHFHAQGTASSAAESELLRLETALNEGVMHHDRPALERILAEEFGLSLPNRPAAPRTAWLGNVGNISLSGYRITEPHISVWSNVAVVQTRQHFDDHKTPGGASAFSDFVIVDLWAFRADRWQLVRRVSQGTRQP